MSAGMRVDSIDIYTGDPDFEFTPVRELEVKCEASNALMPAPTIEEANGRLRALAAKVGANAIVRVEYKSGVSFTSWKSLKATGLAVTRVSDEVACIVCAETIKRAATKCRYCGADRMVEPAPAESATSAVAATPPVSAAGLPLHQEPLRDNNNPALIIGLVVIGLLILSMMMAAS